MTRRDRSAPATSAAVWSLPFISGLTILWISACHIFDLVPVPCSNDNDVQECSGGEVCVDGACAPRPPALEGRGTEPEEDTLEVRRLRVGVAEQRGLGATDQSLWGQPAAVVADLSCAPRCGAVERPLERERAPLIGDVAAASLLKGQAIIRDSAIDTSAPFALELVFRGATVSPATLAGAYTNPEDGWRLEMRGSDAVLRVGSAAVTLVQDAAGVWSHVLCRVDVARLAGGDSGGLLCAVDGQPRSPGEPGGSGTVTPAIVPVRLGDAAGSDGAVAFVRLWQLPDDAPRHDTALMLGALADEGRRRLLDYVGVHVETAGHVLLSNRAGRPRTVELPATAGGSAGVAWVGARWPRLIEIEPTLGMDRAPTPGILFEPRGVSLLQDVGGACVSRTRGPTGRLDACRLGDGTSTTSVAFSTTLDRNTPFVLSVFILAQGEEQAQGAEVQLELASGGTDVNFTSTCTLPGTTQAPAGPSVCGDQFTTQVKAFGPWRRVSWSNTLSYPLGQVRFVSSNAALWAPQLERGTRATSPIPFIPTISAISGSTASSVREADELVLDAVGLGVARDLSVAATLLDFTGRAEPVTLLDDDEVDDGVLRLMVEGAVLIAGGPASFAVTLEGRVNQRPVAASALAEVIGTRVAGHAGALDLPLEPCPSCTETPVAKSHPLQVETVRVRGPHAVVQQIDVTASGYAPVPTDLTLSLAPLAADAPLEDPALFIFQGCPQGPCPLPGSRTLWDRSPSASVPRPGALPGESGLAGRRTTDLLDTDALGALLLEARFQSPEAGPGGNIVEVRGQASAAGLRLQDNARGGFDVLVRVDDSEAALLEEVGVARGEWCQVLCLFGDDVRCIVNLGEPVRAAGVRGRIIDGLVAATVGDDGAGVSVSFARGSAVRGAPDNAEAEALLRRRAAHRFGLRIDERRQTVALREARAASSFVSVQNDDVSLGLVRVGPGWPRVEDNGTGLAYVTAPGGVNALHAALNDAALDDDATGPHPAIPVRVLAPGTRELAIQRDRGVVSLFVQAAQSAAVQLRSGDHTVSGAAMSAGAPAGVVDHGAWQRLWLLVEAGKEVKLHSDAAARVAALQFEPRALSPGAPALNGVLAGDALELVGGDVASSGSVVVRAGVDAARLGGRYLSFVRANSLSIATLSLERAQGGLELYSTQRGFPSVSTALEARFAGDEQLEQHVLWWRDGAVLLGRADGSAQVIDDASFLEGTPTRVQLGGGQLRLRALQLVRGDLRTGPASAAHPPFR